MENSFLPLGYQPQTEEEIKKTEEKEKLYEYYGIPFYATFISYSDL